MRKKNMITFLSSLGAGLEYYDFVIYGMMASYLSVLFFPSDDMVWGMVKTFSIFAVGYVARPFGGIVFGMLGDRFGRRETFSKIMLMMALSTLAIGLLPTTETLGIGAAVLLSLCRIVQGISFGAELPGAITVVSEHQKPESRGMHTGFIFSSTTFGALLASLVLSLLTYTFTKEEILSLWWRLPFILGGVLAIISYIVRSKVQETPAFQENRFEHQEGIFEPLILLIKKYYLQILLSVLMSLLPSSLVITNIYYPTYFQSFFPHPPHDVFNATTIGLIFIAGILPILGLLTDKMDRTKLLVGVTSAFFITTFAFMDLLAYQSFVSLCLFFIINQFFIGLTLTCTMPLMVRLFPTHVRFTGIALSYNISSLLASFLPLIYSAYKTETIVFYVIAGISLLSCCGASVILIKKRILFIEE